MPSTRGAWVSCRHFQSAGAFSWAIKRAGAHSVTSVAVTRRRILSSNLNITRLIEILYFEPGARPRTKFTIHCLAPGRASRGAPTRGGPAPSKRGSPCPSMNCCAHNSSATGIQNPSVVDGA